MQASTARKEAFPDQLLTESEVADLFQLTGRALQAWRVQGLGPPYIKLSNRAIRYRRRDLEQWITTRKRRSTSDPGPELPREDR